MDYLPVAAISISCLSLGASCYGLFRDRARLKLRGEIFIDNQGNRALEVRIVNVGRRPQYLCWLGQQWGRTSSRHSIVPYGLEDFESQIDDIIHHRVEQPFAKLGEGELFRVCILHDQPHQLLVTPVNQLADNIWIEDALGKRFRIPSIKKTLREFYKYYNNRMQATDIPSAPDP